MSQTGSSRPHGKLRSALTAWRFPRWLVPAIYAVSGLAFIEDLCRDNTLAYGIFYAPLIATSVFHKGRAGLWIVSGIACLMVVIGAFLPVFSPDMPDMIGNRVLSILAIVYLRGRYVPLGLLGIASWLMFSLNGNWVSVYRYALPVATLYLVTVGLWKKLRLPFWLLFPVVQLCFALQMLLLCLYINGYFAG